MGFSNSIPWWRRFYIKLALAYGATVLVAALLSGFINYQISLSSEIGNLRQRLLAIVTALSQTLDANAINRIPLETTQPTPVHEQIKKDLIQVIAQDPDIGSIYILRPTDQPTKLKFFMDYTKQGKFGAIGQEYNASGVPILLEGFNRAVTERKPYEDEFGLSLSAYAPLITTEGHAAGLIGVDVMISQINAIKKNALWVSLLLFGIATLLVLLVSLIIANRVRKPLEQMIEATEKVSNGNFDAPLNLSRTDEFGALGDHFNQMTKDLKDREILRDTFGRYMSKKIASALLATGSVPNLGGEERIVTVLFSDIRNYATISEYLSPAQMIDILNQYFGVMNEVIDDHKGCVIEFLGDAILAVFGAPHYYNEHAEEAVKCACAMRQKLEALNQQWEQNKLAQLWQSQGIPCLEMRIGIHTGPVIVGNLGSHARMKYAVIGDSVNVAARLEQLNNKLGTSILFSDEVKARLSVEMLEMLIEQGEHSVKGRKKQVRAYAI